MKSQVCWDMTLRWLVKVSRHFVGSSILQNAVNSFLELRDIAALVAAPVYDCEIIVTHWRMSNLKHDSLVYTVAWFASVK